MVVVVVVVAALAAMACGSKSGGGGGDRPLVVASIFPIYDLTRQVAGDAVRVELLLRPGRGVHDYNPTTKDARRVAGAKIAFIVGLDLDEWTQKVIESSGADAAIVKLGEKVETTRFRLERVGEVDGDHDGHEGHDEGEHEHEGEHEREDDHEDDHGKPEGHHHAVDADDPHVWLSVPLAIEMVDHIAAELGTAFPEHKGAFGANAKKLKGELEKLHAEIGAEVETFSRKTFVTFHGSFGYFAAEYGLEIAAVIEPYPGKEPSAVYLKEVLEAIGKKPVGALYTEPQLDSRPAEVLAKEARLPLRVLDPVGGLENRESYEQMMRFNLAALAESLK